MTRVAERVGRLAPMAVPVGATPGGNFVGCYWQDNQCHPIAAQELRCVPIDDRRGEASGHGFDAVGTFSLRGEYVGARLALTKLYVTGTGDPTENYGHTVELRLEYCQLAAGLPPSQAADLAACGAPPGVVGLLGSWHLRRGDKHDGCHDDAEMVLWLPVETVTIGYVIPMAVAMPIEQAVPMGVAVDASTTLSA